MWQKKAIALLCLGLVALASAGCNRGNAGAADQPDPLNTVPEAWTPIVIDDDSDSVWRTIDIDTDVGQVEYLLFFTYDNRQSDQPSGPVGAAIFDQQNNRESMSPDEVPAISFQPSGSYIPYRVLPNYWLESGTGFIAPSGNYSSITYRAITREDPSQIRAVNKVEVVDGETTTIEPTREPVQELLIEDGGQTLTVAWWRNPHKGYGAASVHADAGFFDKEYESPDNDTTLLTSFRGRHPFHDRSELCHVSVYSREYITETMTDGIALDIRFAEKPSGIDFCDGASPLPFYPEAVVLKYLLEQESRETLVDMEMITADIELEIRQDIAQGQDEVNERKVERAVQEAVENYFAEMEAVAEPVRNGEKRMLGLFGQPEIPFNEDGESGATVCIELIEDESGYREAYAFSLRHVRPETLIPSTDEFRIEGVDLIDPPPEGTPVDCTIVVPNGTPGRAP